MEYNSNDDKIKDELCKKLNIELIRVDNDDFTKNKDEVVSSIINYINNKYNLSIKTDLSKIKNVIRYSGKCRKIICTDTMEIYNSYIELKDKIPNINIRDVLNVCNGTFPNYKGFHYQYYEEGKIYEKTNKCYEYHYKHVLCKETNEVFESVNQLIKFGVSAIWDCLSGKQKTANGLHWEYTDGNITDINNTIKLIKNYSTHKKIICITNGIIYNSSKEASEKTGIYFEGIERCCRGEMSNTHGLKFQYLDEPHEFKPNKKLKQIKCLETNEVFNGIKEAMKRFNAPNEQVISRVCCGDRKTYKGYHLVYV